MSKSRDWRAREMIPDIIVAEEDWENLFGYLKYETAIRGHSFNRLAHYGKHLILTHKEGLGELLKDALLGSANSASNRRHYSELTKDLRMMKKMGYGKIVSELVAKFNMMYRHRPAMMEELSKL